MRKRNQRIVFYLTKEEEDQLNKKVKRTNYSRDGFLRQLVKGAIIQEAPTAEFHEVIRYLRQNGSTLDQLLRLARLRELDTESLEIALAHNHATEQMLWDIFYLSL